MRRTRARLVGSATIPIVRAADVAFHFPRYHAAEHLTTVLPELKSAKAALSQPEWEGKEEALLNLIRAQEIFESMQQNSLAMAKELRFVVASKLRLLDATRPALKVANAPQGTVALVLRDTSVALSLVDWEASDAQYDAMCVVLAAYVKAFSQAHRCGGVALKEPLSAEDQQGLKNALTWCKQLQGHALRERQGLALKRFLPALRVIEALIIVALEGNFVKAIDITSGAAQLASDFISPQHGLYGSIQAEMLARASGWSHGVGFVDERIASIMRGGHQHYSSLFGHPSYPAERQQPIEEVTGFDDLRDYFSASLMTAAQFYLQAPHDKASDDWLPPELLTYSPIVNMPTTAQPHREEGVKLALSHVDATRQALHLAERALKVNRSLLPDDRDNLKAAEILRTMGIAYADLKDYLYATGMWNAAKRIYDKHYGPVSRESTDIMRLLEKFQRKVGSTKEADATKHQLDAILEQHGCPPS